MSMLYRCFLMMLYRVAAFTHQCTEKTYWDWSVVGKPMESILTSARESAWLGGRSQSAEVLRELQVVEKFLGKKQWMAPWTCLGNSWHRFSNCLCDLGWIKPETSQESKLSQNYIKIHQTKRLTRRDASKANPESELNMGHLELPPLQIAHQRTTNNMIRPICKILHTCHFSLSTFMQGIKLIIIRIPNGTLLHQHNGMS